MTDLTAFCESVERTSIAQAMANSSWLFPTVETVHLAAMVLLVGSISAFDLRLLGLILRRELSRNLPSVFWPFTWSAFAIMAITGILLFGSDPVHKYCPNPSFRTKLVLIALAGLNMSIFHLSVYKSVHQWDSAPSPPCGRRWLGRCR